MLTREAAGIRPTPKKNGRIILARCLGGDPSSDVAIHFLFRVGREYGICAFLLQGKKFNFIWIYVYVIFIQDYKDRKCAVNENPSVRVESAGSKTSDNHQLKNRSVVSNFLFGNLSTFTRAIMHSKQYGGSLVCVTL